nr:uncharacterized protein LOC108058533 [Drosophila takahashii]
MLHLYVGLAGTPRSYDEFRVLSVFKHPAFSQDFKNDIAILKLNRPVTIDKMKPLCMFTQKKHQESAQSTLPFTVFDYVQAGDHITILEKDVAPINPRYCSYIIGNTIEANQICLQTPQGMSHNYGNRGDLLAKKIMYTGKEWIVVLGIVSYTSKGLQVFTNVIEHTDWITQIVTSNQ